MENLTAQFDQFYSLKELNRVIAYCKRFINFKKRSEEIERNFTTEELDKALMAYIKLVQEEEFSEEIDRIKRDKHMKGDSKPYLGKDGILRVGGRLRQATLNDHCKHPGSDAYTRVYGVKSSLSVIVKICISKLCPLPIDTE